MFLTIVSTKSMVTRDGVLNVHFQPSGSRLLAAMTMLSVLSVLLLLPCGCRAMYSPSFPESLNSPRPAERARAARQAVDYPYATPADRLTVIELLVGRLDDEDAAVRFFAILALEKMTGTRLGYKYHDPIHERLRAVDSWRRYLVRQADEIRMGKVSNLARPVASSPHHDAGGGPRP